jgi:hypothetical protein
MLKRRLDSLWSTVKETKPFQILLAFAEIVIQKAFFTCGNFSDEKRSISPDVVVKNNQVAMGPRRIHGHFADAWRAPRDSGAAQAPFSFTAAIGRMPQRRTPRLPRAIEQRRPDGSPAAPAQRRPGGRARRERR